MEQIVEILKKEGNKGAEKAAEILRTNPGSVNIHIKLVDNNDKKLKNALIKTFNILSKDNPELVYGNFEDFFKHVCSGDNILKWNCMSIISNIAKEDPAEKVNENVLKNLFDNLKNESMVTAGNTIVALGEIARAKPHYRESILARLPEALQGFRENECNHIIAGKIILVYKELFDKTGDESLRTMMREFAEKQIKSPRNATAKKAKNFLKGV